MLASGAPNELVASSGAMAAGLLETANAHCWNVLPGRPRQQGLKAVRSPVKSTTCTVKLHGVELLLDASCATAVTVVNPGGNSEPLGGVEVTEATEQLSDASGVKFTNAPHCAGSRATTRLAGH